MGNPEEAHCTSIVSTIYKKVKLLAVCLPTCQKVEFMPAIKSVQNWTTAPIARSQLSSCHSLHFKSAVVATAQSVFLWIHPVSFQYLEEKATQV